MESGLRAGSSSAEVDIWPATLYTFQAFLAAEAGGERWLELRQQHLNPEYFHVLKSNGVAHTFNSWTRMSSLRRQVLISEAFTGPFTAARALRRPGRSYEQAVEMYSPYTEIKEEYPSARHALRDIIAQARERDIAAYIHVNNRFEGNAIETIDEVLSSIDN